VTLTFDCHIRSPSYSRLVLYFHWIRSFYDFPALRKSEARDGRTDGRGTTLNAAYLSDRLIIGVVCRYCWLFWHAASVRMFATKASSTSRRTRIVWRWKLSLTIPQWRRNSYRNTVVYVVSVTFIISSVLRLVCCTVHSLLTDVFVFYSSPSRCLLCFVMRKCLTCS